MGFVGCRAITGWWVSLALSVLTSGTPALESLITREAPSGVIRSILHNTGNEPVSLGAPRILDGRGNAVTVYWVMAEPREVAPDGYAFVTFMPHSQEWGLPYRAEFETLSCDLAALSAPPILATYAVCQEGQAYFYLKNEGGEPCTVTGLRLSGTHLSIDASVTVPPGDGNVVVADYNAEPPSDGAVSLQCVELETQKGDLIPATTRLFQMEHTVMRAVGGADDVAECLSHKPPSIEAGAAEAIAVIEASSGKLRTLKFCNMDLLSSNNGPHYFAQLTERNHIEPQLGYSGDVDTPAYLGKLLGELEKIKERTAPGMFYLWLFARDNHAAEKPRYSLSHIRNTAYTSLAAGSKGIEFYPFEKEGMEAPVLAAIERLQSELQGLQALIANSEPLPQVGGSTEQVAVRALRCGAQGMLLFYIPVLLPEGDASAPTSVTATFAPPLPLSRDGVELGGLSERIALTEQDGLLAATAEVESDVRVFYVPAGV